MKLLNILFQLQEIDKEIAQLRANQQRLPKRAMQRQKELDVQKKRLLEAEDQTKAKKLSIKEQESQIASCQETSKKKQSQLNQIKNNREYTALTEEIKQLKVDKQKLEDQVIQNMEEADHLKAQSETHKKELAELEKEFAEFKKEMAEDLKKIEEELSQLQKKRAEQKALAEKEESEIVARYERVLSVDGKSGMVAVDENACGFCHVELLPNEAARLRAGKIVFCKDCSRILYFRDMLNV